MTALSADLRMAAFAAITEARRSAPALGPDWALEVRAAKIMREATGLQQVDVGPAIRWAIAHPEVAR
jgi:hypothetical protein